jgi:hypothetical protein
VKARGNLALWEISRKGTRYLLLYKEVQKAKYCDFRDKHKKEGRATESEEYLVL